MIIALLVGWVLAGLLLALLVGAAVRIAEVRSDRTRGGHAPDMPQGQGEDDGEVARAA